MGFNDLVTANEKTILARFLYTALDYLDSGYSMVRPAYTFEDDPEAESSLPLAYLMDENNDDESDET